MGNVGYFGTPQSLSVLSLHAETTRRPSGDTATPWTYDGSLALTWLALTWLGGARLRCGSDNRLIAARGLTISR